MERTARLHYFEQPPAIVAALETLASRDRPRFYLEDEETEWKPLSVQRSAPGGTLPVSACRAKQRFLLGATLCAVILYAEGIALAADTKVTDVPQENQPALPRFLSGISLGEEASGQGLKLPNPGDDDSSWTLTDSSDRKDFWADTIEARVTPETHKVYRISGEYKDVVLGGMSFVEVVKLRSKEYGRPKVTSASLLGCGFKEMDAKWTEGTYLPIGRFVKTCVIWQLGSTRLLLGGARDTGDAERTDIRVAIEDVPLKALARSERVAIRKRQQGEESTEEARRKEEATKRLQDLP